MRQIMIILTLFLGLIVLSKSANAYYDEQEISLKGNWSFKIGDDPDWASEKYNDLKWIQIQTPSRWEEQGFQGYDGFAWYRKSVVIPTSFTNHKIIIELGYIDDVDEVFFNGVKIGQTGSFPPRYSTAYDARRIYEIPQRLIKFDGSNSIAVRIYDSGLEGGIVRGNLRLYTAGLIMIPDIDLTGKWAFNTGKSLNLSVAKSILVPGQWENQGYLNYDGYAVYARKFELSKAMINQRLILLAGRIDDADEVYINGQLIGATGNYKTRDTGQGYAEFRNYNIQDGVLKVGENLIEIRVYDRGGEGGILEGPIGIITQNRFIEYWRSVRKR